jgi:hypothetical protein
MAKRTIVTLVLIIIAVMTAAAQSGVSIGPQVGIYKAQDADGTRVMGGVALRLRLPGMLGVEGSVNYRKEQYNNGLVSVNSWPVMVTGLLYPLPILYGAMGAGWYNTSIDYNIPAGYLGGPATITTETKQEFGWHFGGGVELPLGSTAKLVGDIKYVFLNYDFTSLPGSNGVNSNFYVITAGLLFSL